MKTHPLLLLRPIQKPVVMHAPVVAVEEVVPWVTLSLNLMNWEFMNFEVPMRTSTYLFSIRKMLEDRHGRIQDLKICLGNFLEEKEMTVRRKFGKECLESLRVW